MHGEEQEDQRVFWAAAPQESVLCKTTSELLSNGKSLRRRGEVESYTPEIPLSSSITMLLLLWDFFALMHLGDWESVSGWRCSLSHALVANGGSGGIRLMLGSPSRPCGVYNLNRSHRLKGWGRSGECHEVM